MRNEHMFEGLTGDVTIRRTLHTKLTNRIVVHQDPS